MPWFKINLIVGYISSNIEKCISKANFHLQKVLCPLHFSRTTLFYVRFSDSLNILK